MSRNPFVILASGRTGSNWLESLLGSHPDIACFGEIHRTDPVHTKFYIKKFHGTFGFRPATFPATLRTRFLYWYGLRKRAAVGFRLFPGHLRSLKSLQRTRGLRVICLRRRNLLRKLVSLQIAEQTSRWVQRGASLSPSLRRTEIDANKLQDYAQRMTDSADWLEAGFSHVPQLSVTYEDLCADTDGQCRRVLEFLDVRTVPLQSHLQKINPEPLSELVINFSTLRQELEGSPLAWMTEPADARDAA